MKLVMMVVGGEDVSALTRALVDAGHPVTRIGSAGGFLGRGSTTLFAGVPDVDVEAVIGIVREHTESRVELVPSRQLPFLSSVDEDPEPHEVRRGGAVIWVLPVERFERI